MNIVLKRILFSTKREGQRVFKVHYSVKNKVCNLISNRKVWELPNGEILMGKYSGNCQLTNDLILRDVLYVPEFKVNLISVGKFIPFNQ